MTGSVIKQLLHQRRGSTSSGLVREVCGIVVDFQRVNFEVVNLEPFAWFAFPVSPLGESSLNWPGFGDELVTSFSAVTVQRKG